MKKIIVQIKIGSGKTIEDLIRFNNDLKSINIPRIIKSIRTQEGVRLHLYKIDYSEVAGEYVKNLKAEGFKVTIN